MGLTSSLDKIDTVENYRKTCLVRSPTKIIIKHNIKMESAFQVPCVSLVYCLQLEDNKWYVGTSNQINLRIAGHIVGEGARWTRIYKFQKIHSVCLGGRGVEKQVTLQMMLKHGWKNVRGAGWCKPDMRRPPSDLTALTTLMERRQGEVKLAVVDSTPRPADTVKETVPQVTEG